jgi:2-aminomuconate deaminase
MLVEDGLGRVAINLSENAPLPLGAYSHAVQAGPFVYLCGLGARHPQTGREEGVVLDGAGQVVSYDIAAQTRQVMENLITVLKAAHCQLPDLVDVTVYLRDMKDFAAYNAVYAEYFSFADPPARTTIEARPPGHNFIEIKAVAYRPLANNGEASR